MKLGSKFCLNLSIMNHARIFWRSFSYICDISISVSVSGLEFRNREKIIILGLTIACQDACGGNT